MKLFEHFQNVGLDTITYLPDLSSIDLSNRNNNVSMHSVVSEYARFGTYKDRALQVAQHYHQHHFDHLDKSSSDSAKAILFKSMDRKSKDAFSHLIEPKNCLAVVWIQLISTAVVMNEETILSCRALIKDADPKAYEHENLSKLCQALKPHVKALVNVGCYESCLSIKLLQNMINMTTPNKTFELAVGLKLETLKKANQPLAYLQPYKQTLSFRRNSWAQ